MKGYQAHWRGVEWGCILGHFWLLKVYQSREAYRRPPHTMRSFIGLSLAFAVASVAHSTRRKSLGYSPKLPYA
ncbi:hypothetical protein BS47DRAFT_1354498 [Hydnum rufescens UP504]|uniref:Uncharacterized protein n=1 Tax=Hydnum rufescens UP504 TaxID=1448309 RepID=A0A9P6AFM8_9AGAM|nr:hypothetical protein BS47DRAFT_1354498 [Hydnum rufescens UP504]